MKCRRRKAAAPAFTLLEVLAAMMLIAIVLPVAMRGISLATGAGTAARQRTEASALAESKLAELLATDGWETGNLSGTFDDSPDYRWDAQVNDWVNVSPTTQNLHQIDLRVTWTSRGANKSVTLSTLVYTRASTTGGAS